MKRIITLLLLLLASPVFATDPVADAISSTTTLVTGYVQAIGLAFIVVATLWIGFFVGWKYVRKLEYLGGDIHCDPVTEQALKDFYEGDETVTEIIDDLDDALDNGEISVDDYADTRSYIEDLADDADDNDEQCENC